MENARRGGGEGRAGYNTGMIFKRDARAPDCVARGGDKEKWTELRNLQKAKCRGCSDGAYIGVLRKGVVGRDAA